MSDAPGEAEHGAVCAYRFPYELAAELRALLRANTPRLIALTGYGQEHDQQRAAAAGFAQHLVEPVGFEALRQAIEELIRR
jgi:CheY-like chemotaxis protein